MLPTITTLHMKAGDRFKIEQSGGSGYGDPFTRNPALVLEDMLGLSPRVPKFVKRYGDLGPGIDRAVADYAAEVRNRAFPGPEHVYAMKKKP